MLKICMEMLVFICGKSITIGYFFILNSNNYCLLSSDPAVSYDGDDTFSVSSVVLVSHNPIT